MRGIGRWGVDAVVLRVVRGKAYVSYAVSFNILVDGVNLGRVGNGATTQLLLSPGRHTFQITQTLGYRSKKLDADCGPGDQIELHCLARALGIDVTLTRIPAAAPSNPQQVRAVPPPPPPRAVPTPPAVPSVFVSYSHEDQQYVQDLVRHLAAAGLPIWYDNAIATGQSFSLDIEKAIDGCFAFAVVLTPNSIASQWVRQELSRARRLGKPIWPLMLLACDPPLEIEGIQVESVHGGTMPSTRYVDGLRGLHRSATT
jgi:hypothetical protein